MVGLTLFAEVAAAIACGGFALSLADLAGARNRLTIAAVGAAAGFFIGLLTQLGMPLLALPIAVLTVAGLDRWISALSDQTDRVHSVTPALHHPIR
jgi:hypothetical protein